MTFQTPAGFPAMGNWHIIDVVPVTDTEVAVIFVCPDCARTTEGEEEKPVPVTVTAMMLELQPERGEMLEIVGAGTVAVRVADTRLVWLSLTTTD
jgi:hypothetical protein